MDRAELAVLLGEGTPARAGARAALLGGGDFVVWDGGVPARRLAGVYAARLRRAARRGTETVALASTVDTLTRLGAAPVLVGSVVSPESTWAYVVFLAEDATEVLACTGVRRSER